MDNVQVNSLDIVYDRVVRQSSVKWSLAWATSLSPRTATQLWLWLDSATWQRHDKDDMTFMTLSYYDNGTILLSGLWLDSTTWQRWYDIMTLWHYDNVTMAQFYCRVFLRRDFGLWQVFMGCEMNVEGCDVGQVSRLWFFHDSPYHCDIWHMTWLRHYGQ